MQVPYVDLVLRRKTVHKRSPSVEVTCASSSRETRSPSASASRKRRRIEVESDRDTSPRCYSATKKLKASTSGVKHLSVSPSASAESLPLDISDIDNSTHSDYEEEILDEDEQLLLDGEGPPDDSSDSLPIRTITNFKIYHQDTLEPVNIGELLLLDASSRKHYSASGLARPWTNPNDDDDDMEDTDDTGSQAGSEQSHGTHASDGQQLRLSVIKEFSRHCTEDDRMDMRLWIRTQYAWYILGYPAPDYLSFFSEFWIKTRVLDLIINASLDDPRLAMDDLYKRIPDLDSEHSDPHLVTATELLGRKLDEHDLDNEDVKVYVLSYLREVCEDNEIKIHRVPAIRELLAGALDYASDGSNAYNESNSSKSVKPKRRIAPTLPRTGTALNREKEVLKHRSNTFLMPVVDAIARGLFQGSLEVAATLLDKDPDHILANTQARRHKKHRDNPSEIIWGPNLKNNLYSSVTVDGEVYNIGDVVMVEPDQEAVKPEVFRASQTVNKYGNKYWFCQIRSFFEDDDRKHTKKFHGLWFSHGSKTLLQETSHSKALYLLNACDDIEVAAIFQKCNLTILNAGEEEKEDDGSHNANDFHCGYLYDEDTASFADIPPDALDISVKAGYKACFSCDSKVDKDASQIIEQVDDRTVMVHGMVFHEDDFVFFCPSTESKVLEIGQIKEIHEDHVEVALLGRYDDYVSHQKDRKTPLASSLICDERKLFFSDNVVSVTAHRLDGICYVMHLTDPSKIEKWVVFDDHFYFDEKGSVESLESMDVDDFVYCRECYEGDKEERKKTRKFLQTNSKLIGMELFSGAGGLGIGMDLSGFVETKHAVEFSPSAAMSYMHNQPETTVYCQDSSNLLKLAYYSKETPQEKLAPLKSNIDGKTDCPPLPGKDAGIDFIFGDQHWPVTCSRLLDHKLYSTGEVDGNKVECEVKGGMVKVIVRCLLALGYQVRYSLLQAGQYGAPQSRRRVIFIAARRGLPLPDFPAPVYAFVPGSQRFTLSTLKKINPVTRSKDPKNPHQFAPLRPRTVDDAIGDLPAFDWENPHEIIKATPSDLKESRKRRQEKGIAHFEATRLGRGLDDFNELPGFPEGAPYPMQPQNRYQKWLRRNMDEDDLVSGQYTTVMGSKVVEATCNVPLKPLADHRKLPVSLLPDFVKPSMHNIKKNRILYGRMDPKGHFRCLVTTLSPTLKNQWPLHPTQKRIITVREAARSQGFPDDYIFKSINTKPTQIIEDQLRQIGNAVAVPFALALGKELGKAMIKAWEVKQREGSVAL
ncbi:hypothetical protein D9613_003147 [Agrocybe pediades]|uniref:DNA (cytosine-5-)-methyltransferase n=1 Tax=Agrocybe pediades TaxID=84607 RepID=A0A8H4QPG8_9AGAR|nr:hypothetical protein D9613_003147 [Agrocybe pediades]